MKDYIRDGRAPIPDKEITSKIMSSIKSKNTKPEVTLRKHLWSNGIRGYRLHWKKVPGKPDIVFPGKHLAIFVNGCFWHRCPRCSPALPRSNSEFWRNKFDRNVIRDEIKRNELNKLGWKVMTIWECEIKNDLDAQVDKIKKELEG